MSLFLLFFSFFSVVAQDSIPAKLSVLEEKNIRFQEVFFKALSEKAIKNHQNAINNLEEANQLIPNNKAVFFELSKNYFLLDKPFEAKEYGYTALKEDPENLWLLEHLVKINKRENNFNEAIKLQNRIVEKHPKKKRDLVYLFLQSNNIADAKKTLLELKEEKILTTRLRRILANLEKRKSNNPSKKITENNVKKTSLAEDFNLDKSFSSLKKLLEKLALEKASDLEKYSQQGINLFPAQPLVYLMSGKAHNNNKSYKKALENLQNGFDFVIDDVKMETQFYKEMAIAYQGLGNTKEADKYRKKAKK